MGRVCLEFLACECDACLPYEVYVPVPPRWASFKRTRDPRRTRGIQGWCAGAEGLFDLNTRTFHVRPSNAPMSFHDAARQHVALLLLDLHLNDRWLDGCTTYELEAGVTGALACAAAQSRLWHLDAEAPADAAARERLRHLVRAHATVRWRDAGVAPEQGDVLVYAPDAVA